MVKVLRSIVRGPLEPHVAGFAEELLRQGYSRSAAEQHVAIQDSRGLNGSSLVGRWWACRLDRCPESTIMAGCPGRRCRLTRS